ncbi:hypothetical protein [Adhaeribacter radiodurans]|uniref:Uncharacterized protein n=1 Tax=Adhaeribacter radiodurans TaxID=2745197 RepID=A0A7L7L917_9BACT|nr:hypothetical protein [Adhaeribacter radiodurans]QMU29332.1 hypothetical protein HUW48_15390 [Adhaeribacter radiodurans]
MFGILLFKILVGSSSTSFGSVIISGSVVTTFDASGMIASAILTVTGSLFFSPELLMATN